MSLLHALLIVASGLFLSSGSALAQGPGSFAERQLEMRMGNSVRIDTSFVASDGCQAILGARSGAPAGVSVHNEILPVTVTVGRDPGGCSGDRVLRRVFAVGGSAIHNLVEIFFVSPDGRVLRSEKVAIAPG
jgi:hypothetical protein